MHIYVYIYIYTHLFLDSLFCPTGPCLNYYAFMHAKSLQPCLTLCPMDYSLPGSSVHGVFQARVQEWVVMPSSRGSS